MNLIVQECFLDLVKRLNILSEDALKRFDYLADSLLLTILDQIWIQQVYEPLQNDLIDALQFEIIRHHSVPMLDELFHN